VEEIKYPVNPEKGVTIHAYIKDGSVKLESIDISPSKQKQDLALKYVKIWKNGEKKMVLQK